jgi:hypothetical protein
VPDVPDVPLLVPPPLVPLGPDVPLLVPPPLDVPSPVPDVPLLVPPPLVPDVPDVPLLVPPPLVPDVPPLVPPPEDVPSTLPPLVAPPLVVPPLDVPSLVPPATPPPPFQIVLGSTRIGSDGGHTAVVPSLVPMVLTEAAQVYVVDGSTARPADAVAMHSTVPPLGTSVW